MFFIILTNKMEHSFNTNDLSELWLLFREKNSKQENKWVIKTRVLNIKTNYHKNTTGLGYNKIKELNTIHEFTTDLGFSINSNNRFIGNPKNSLQNAIVTIGSTLEIHCLDDNCTQILVFKKIE